MKKYESQHLLIKTVKVLFAALLLTGFLSPLNAQAQESSDLTGNLVRYLGLYVFNTPRGNPPKFEKVRWISIDEFPNQNIHKPETDAKGYTKIDGYVETIDDEKLKFKTAFLIKNRSGHYENFEFETEALNGVHYTFKGRFLKRSLNHGGIYTNLIGTMRRYKNGEYMGEINDAPFSKYAIM